MFASLAVAPEVALPKNNVFGAVSNSATPPLPMQRSGRSNAKVSVPLLLLLILKDKSSP